MIFDSLHPYIKWEWNLNFDHYLYLTSFHHANSSEIIPGEGTRIER